MSEIQTLEIIDVLKSLPSEKLAEVKDFAVFLKERYGDQEIIDESDEWTDEDYRDASNASMRYADEFDEVGK